MRLLVVTRAVVGELVSLVVDDLATFLGGVTALVVMYVLAHDAKSLKAVAGFVAFGLVWASLAVSFVRAGRGGGD